MKIPFTELATGLATAVTSVLLVLGALLTSQAEVLPAPQAVSQITATLPSQTSETPAAAQTSEPGSTPTVVLSPTNTATPRCAPPPAGWQAYTVQQGDTLEQLSANFIVPPDQIRRVNCLFSDVLTQDSSLFLPIRPTATPTLTATSTATATLTSTPKKAPVQEDTPIPTPTPTKKPFVCGHPAGWVNTYVVKPGDTLSSIARLYNLTYPVIQAANCLTRPDLIYAGMRLYVPNIPTVTPTYTQVPTRKPSTSTPLPPSATALPPSSTPETPTLTSIPPTDTSIPPTDTSAPPTDTPAAPTDTPTSSGPTPTFTLTP